MSAGNKNTAFLVDSAFTRQQNDQGREIVTYRNTSGVAIPEGTPCSLILADCTTFKEPCIGKSAADDDPLYIGAADVAIPIGTNVAGAEPVRGPVVLFGTKERAKTTVGVVAGVKAQVKADGTYDTAGAVTQGVVGVFMTAEAAGLSTVFLRKG